MWLRLSCNILWYGYNIVGLVSRVSVTVVVFIYGSNPMPQAITLCKTVEINDYLIKIPFKI